MAKILVHFNLSHNQEQVTQGNVIVDIDPGKHNLHEQVIEIIASQFNCRPSLISITQLLINP
jgi:hypothetical protein